MISRRTFVQQAAATAAIAATARSASAKSYTLIAGANERINVATMGLNGRGKAHLAMIANNSDHARMAYCCDVDTNVLAEYTPRAAKALGYTPRAAQDFRHALDDKDVDAITIATPDHWHAPMAVLGLKAGKHVYVEKPSSHNPREGELLIAAQKKYGKLVQVGDQQRSSAHTIRIIEQIHGGLIGDAYYAKAFYANNRGPIGVGKVTAPPPSLDWDLWQGPAPRSAYKDNIHPYNWHWLFRYGTGETLNNGTHEVDICRWALDANYPTRVTTSGGRYAAHDDWQFMDTTVTSFEYGPDKMITWEGRSCNGLPFYGRDRGMTIHGTKGSVLLDRMGYEVYDLAGKLTDSFKTGERSTTRDLVGHDAMTDAHFANFIAGIRSGETLHSPIEIANISVTMLQISNIAWGVGHDLHVDTHTGHILDSEAMKQWGRDYEKGWEVRV